MHLYEQQTCKLREKSGNKTVKIHSKQKTAK